MSDDPNEARRAAAEELRENLRFMRAAGIAAEVVFYDRGGDCDLSRCPDGDGEGIFIPITIGSRGNLGKAEARRAAAMWRQATGRYPKACFMVCLLGYNDDPREIWEFRDARTLYEHRDEPDIEVRLNRELRRRLREEFGVLAEFIEIEVLDRVFTKGR
jgi:hypothetical protein